MALLLPLDIVNAACALFGDEPLESLDDDAIGGQAAALLYQNVVDFNLGIYPWSFGKKLFQLSVNDVAKPWAGYSKVFDLPPERLDSPVYVTDDVTCPNRRFADFALEGNKCHASSEALWAMCRYSVNPDLWSAAFRRATITALGADLARSRAHDKTMAAKLHSEAYGSTLENYRGGMMRAAINADSFGTPPRPQNRDNNPLTNAWRS